MRRIAQRSAWLVVILFAGAKAHAANGTWGVDVSGNWSDAGNWASNIIADGVDSTATFASITDSATATVDTNRTIGNVIFTDTPSRIGYWSLASSNGAALTLARTEGIPIFDMQSFANVSATLAGTNGLLKTGGFSLELTGDNTYTGGTVITFGALIVNKDANLGHPSSSVTLDNGTLHVKSSFVTTRNFALAAPESSGLGNLISTGTTAVLTVNGVVSGEYPTSQIRIGDYGTVAFNGANTYQGWTVLFSVLRAIDGVGLPTASNLHLVGGSFQSNGVFTRSVGSGAGQVRWNNSGGFSAFGGPLAIQLGGNTSSVTWGGLFVPSQAELRLNHATADSLVDFQNGINLFGGARKIQVADNPSSSTDLAQISGPITNGDIIVGGPGTLILAGANSYATSTINATTGNGTLQIGNGGITGTLGTGAVSLLGTVTLAFNRSNNYAVANSITSDSTSASIIQRGNGATSLTGTMTGYSGAITVSAGALLINTTVGGIGVVTVDGGTLGGIGSLGTRPVEINAGGTLAPGVSIESLNTGSVSFADNDSRFNPEIDLGATLAADLLNVTGSITLTGSTLDVDLLNLPTSQTLPLTFLLMNNDAADPVTGEFGIIDSPIGFGVTVNYAYTGADALGRLGDGNDIAVTVTPVPEPSAILLALLFVPAMCTLRRRRR